MRASGPTAWPAHSTLELRESLFNANISCLCLFAGGDPADPLIAREWGDVLPYGFYLWLILENCF